ncbi:hypothetical protein L596_015933 [Steinernema carpocapsae]|uniref:Uncharacterized protein n=1 Tax=Steinernema carpocapsae TaxID=34508 RepID=A0A4U5NGL7_STECR|nr:hypothetical protein L596_015933 [Steinernema carpocapsae]
MISDWLRQLAKFRFETEYRKISQNCDTRYAHSPDEHAPSVPFADGLCQHQTLMAGENVNRIENVNENHRSIVLNDQIIDKCMNLKIIQHSKAGEEMKYSTSSETASF